MTKSELIEAIQKSHKDLSKVAIEQVVETAFSTVAGGIKKDGRFAYPGFGTFILRNRKARKGRNPQTGETLNIKASKTVGFKPAPVLKKSL
jgi:DNA-binding protein HU-beta